MKVWNSPPPTAMCHFVSCEIPECCELLATLLAGEVHAGRWLGTDWGTG